MRTFGVVGLAVGLMSTSVQAAVVALTVGGVTDVSVRAWKLQNYGGDFPVAFSTGSVCTTNSGSLRFGSSSTVPDRERFWSLLMAAKLGGKKVFFFYNDANCEIDSFGLSAEAP